MPRYILFAGAHYYPQGGMEDRVSEADDMESLIAKALSDDGFGPEYQWAHILDTEIMKVVWETECSIRYGTREITSYEGGKP